tara:strand:+ start:764 stop:958 length:195 start_codon:yes stop_codon:yes gene_type:complete
MSRSMLHCADLSDRAKKLESLQKFVAESFTRSRQLSVSEEQQQRSNATPRKFSANRAEWNAFTN